MTQKVYYRVTSVLLALTMAFTVFGAALAAPPSNDNFIDAQLISSLPFSATIDMTEAGIEPDEPERSCTNIERSVWYSFVPSESMTVRLSMTGSGISNALGSILRVDGPGISGLTVLRCAYAVNPPVDLQLDAGQIYYLQASTFAGEVGTIQINMEQLPAPTNDHFIEAEEIGSLPFTATEDLTAASLETGEPPSCYIGMNRTVWYSFTALENTIVRADMLGSSINNVNVNVYRLGVSGISDLQFLTCSALSVGGAIFPVTAGQTYYFQAGNLFGEVGTIQINVQQIIPPFNDNFADAGVINSMPFSTSVDVAGAGLEQDETQFCGDLDKTVWYYFTPTENMTVRLDTQGTPISSNVSIYRAGVSGLSDLQFLTCASSNSGIFQVEQGQTYYFQAGAPPGWSGTIQINLQQLVPPANDDFDNAISTNALPFSHAQDTSNASSAVDDPTDCFNNGSVWYQFTPAGNTTITAEANTFGSNYDTTLGVYTGTRGALTQVPGGCNDDASGLQSRVVFNAIGGTTYYFMLGFCCGNGGTGGGNLVFSIMEHVRVPPQANFSYSPGDPSKFDTIQFFDGTHDPEGLGFLAWDWDFGDGTTASEQSPRHLFTVDGDYPVTLTVTTVDGRTASTTQVVQVRTHDVAITRITAPNSANAGQTKTITVNLRNRGYPETVQVDLYKSVPGGFQWVASITKEVPALSGNRTASASFNYTFTSDDARIGKVTFKVVATLLGARDALLVDNEAISSPPTKVGR